MSVSRSVAILNGPGADDWDLVFLAVVLYHVTEREGALRDETT